MFADSNKWYVFKGDKLTQFLEIHTSETAYTEDDKYILLIIEYININITLKFTYFFVKYFLIINTTIFLERNMFFRALQRFPVVMCQW